MVSRMTEALSNWLVMAPGRGNILANSKNSKFSLPRRERAAFRDFSLRRFCRLTDGAGVRQGEVAWGVGVGGEGRGREGMKTN